MHMSNLLVIGRAGDDLVAAVVGQLMTVRAAARAIGCDKGTVYAEIQRGNIRSHKVSGLRFVLRSEVNDYKARRRGQRFAEAFPTRESEL
jgi:excisionase family DNA binding protein